MKLARRSFLKRISALFAIAAVPRAEEEPRPEESSEPCDDEQHTQRGLYYGLYLEPDTSTGWHKKFSAGVRSGIMSKQPNLLEYDFRCEKCGCKVRAVDTKECYQCSQLYNSFWLGDE